MLKPRMAGSCKDNAIFCIPGFSSPLSYVFWRMRLAVRKKWQIQVRSGNCVCPIMMDDCKCGKTITHCVVVTPLSPVNGPSQGRIQGGGALGAEAPPPPPPPSYLGFT